MQNCTCSVLQVQQKATVTIPHNKQLLVDEVEHDIMNYQNRGLCCLPKPKAEADTQTRGFDNSGYHAKTEFNNCFIIHFHIIHPQK